MENLRHYILEETPADVVERYLALPQLAQESDFGFLDTDVVVIDTETTGLSFSRDELIQIAAARMDHGEVTDWFVTFVNPGKPIPEDIVHLTSITDDDVKDAPSPNDALEKLARFCEGCTLVAHNVEFDRTFTTKHPGGYPLLENTWVDSLDLSRIALPRLKSHRLIDLVKAFDAPISTHRADDDVAATCVVYRILLAAVSCMPEDLVAYIAGMVEPDIWSTVEVFRYFDEKNRMKALVQSGEERKPFSLYDMRNRRVAAMPAYASHKDADDLVGSLSYPSQEKTRQAFASDGLLGRIYEDYEPRSEQVDMALGIADAFNRSENLVVEAGTGVGKSMAYLVPATAMARQNGISVGVATKTNALLDQLVYEEIPALANALAQEEPSKEPLTWSALKGMGHYLCLRKVQALADNGPGFREVNAKQVSQAPALAALLSFVEQTEFGDMDVMKIDYRAVPRYLFTTTSRECLRYKCPYYRKSCFVHAARRRAESSDIIVTNHTLLFCDIAADGGLLPPVRHWIIDEAHATEAEARSAFAESVDSDALMRLLGRLGLKLGSRDVFTRAENSLKAVPEEQVTLFFGLISKARDAAKLFGVEVEEYLSRVKDLLYFDPTRKSSGYDRVDIWINDEVRASQKFSGVRVAAHEFIERTDKLIKAIQDLVAYLDGIEEVAVAQREISVVAMELRDIRNAAELIFELAPENYVYQAQLTRKKDRFNDTLQALMLDVGETMNERFYARSHSVVYTSATVTIGESFESFEKSVGLNQSEFSQARFLKLDSHFDFDNNMIIYVVKDMPEPNQPSYIDALVRLLVETHRAQGGSMLTLFTNRREMENCYSQVNPELKKDDLRLVCQKYGVSVKGLRDEFVADQHLSLFALKSFWEGFDAPGATLRGVVIPRLPFARPTDPLYCERANRDDRAWWKYVLPQAIIETKQAAGRLIRKADDYGVLILADKRLLTKRYGKTFLGSLQSKTVRVATIDEIVQSLRMINRG